MAAAQGIDFRKEKLGQGARLGLGTQPAYDLIRDHIPFLEKDAVMYPYMNAVKELVVSGRIVLAVNQKVEDIWEL
jgi:histidine ammonia-lyase